MFFVNFTVYAQGDVPGNPLDIDPTQYCPIVVTQIRDGEVLNKYDKTHIFRMPTDSIVTGNTDLNFGIDLRGIPESYWTLFDDDNGNGVLDELETSWVNFDMEAAESDWRCIQETNVINPNVSPDTVLNYTLPSFGCLIDNLDGSIEFKVGLRYQVGFRQYKSICEQTITVDEKTFDEIGEDATVPEAKIIYDTDDKNHNVNSTWEITIKDVKIPDNM
ncbi:hypothetical protein HY469_03290, partial [Candidatus Roizmanbacteria bacterium]|nr:hypothetical protein [Candidatus Roizmanbacteria bacterium]